MAIQKGIRSLLLHRYSGLAIVSLLGGGVAVSHYARQPETGAASGAILVAQPLDERASQPGDHEAAKQTPGRARETLLAVGDRIKISFFEAFDVPQAKTAAGPQPGMRTFYQRLDLAGDYTIQQDGAIEIPKLGTFQVAARSIRETQSEIAAAFEKEMNRRCDVNIAILERQPVYILGPVKNPGVYKFVPGMTVLHAFAIAGDLDRGAEQFGHVMDLLRQHREEEDIRARLSKALAEQARLKADRDGAERPASFGRLVDVAGKERAEVLLAAETARLDQDRLTFKEETIKRKEEMARTKAELAALEARVAANSSRLQARQKRLAMLQSAGASVLAATVNSAENEKLDLEARHQETLLSIEQAKQKLAQMERQTIFSERDRKAKIAREIAVNDEDINSLEKALRSSSAIANLSERSLESRQGALQGLPSIEIIRQSLGSRTVFKADETTSLEPGDLIRVQPPSPEAARDEGSPNSSFERPEAEAPK